MGVVIEEVFDDHDTRGGEKTVTTSRVVEAYEGEPEVKKEEDADWVKVEEPSVDEYHEDTSVPSAAANEEEEEKNPYMYFHQDDGDDDGMSLEERRERIAEAEGYKEDGNRLYREGEYVEAMEMYTKALEAAPACGVRRKNRERMTEQESSDNHGGDADATAAAAGTKEEVEEEQKRDMQKKCAVYYANRAACQLALKEYDSAAHDCSDAIDLDASYLKAYMRRAMAFEHMEEYDRGLTDAKYILEKIDPSHVAARAYVARVTPLAEKKHEELKDEMMSKLKDLGNSLLGNFGLSLDNFKAEQDPETGSYSVKFSQ